MQINICRCKKFVNHVENVHATISSFQRLQNDISSPILHSSRYLTYSITWGSLGTSEVSSNCIVNCRLLMKMINCSLMFCANTSNLFETVFADNGTVPTFAACSFPHIISIILVAAGLISYPSMLSTFKY